VGLSGIWKEFCIAITSGLPIRDCESWDGVTNSCMLSELCRVSRSLWHTAFCRSAGRQNTTGYLQKMHSSFSKYEVSAESRGIIHSRWACLPSRDGINCRGRKRHDGFQTRDVSRGSRERIPSPWILAYTPQKYCAFSQQPVEIPLHPERL
jgi:hypothetical protein